MIQIALDGRQPEVGRELKLPIVCSRFSECGTGNNRADNSEHA